MRRNYDDPLYTTWRKKVRARDKNRCQMPGCKYKRKRGLQVHHIQKWSSHPHLRYEPANGITLCAWCHKQVTRSEEQYVGLFMQIVRANDGKKS